MPSDIAENEYLNRSECDELREVLENHWELHESNGHIPEQQDTYTLISGETGWEVEITHSSQKSIIHVVPNGVDRVQLEKEVKRAAGSVVQPEFVHRNSNMAEYEYQYDHSK